jgi:uncharacterized protein YjbI with pentapeptide repeats
VLALIWWWVPDALYRSQGGGLDAENARLNAVASTRTALLVGLIGLGVLGTLWLNGRMHEISTRQFEMAERGHLTDRYAKAVEQLGSDTVDVRLGGIYVLERIVNDHPRNRDQETIVEVLSAFVRVHSDPVYQYRASLPKPARSMPVEEQRQKAHEYVLEQDETPADVQAALTVVGRLPRRAGVLRANLTGAHLSRATLFMADLSGADFSGADLTGASLFMAKLNRARLREANLIRANLVKARLTETVLVATDLTDADLGEADLRGADLGKANLTGARLVRANLSGAALNGADLTGADLGKVNLTGAYLGKANLTGAYLGGADLTGAGLGGADLIGVKGLTQEQLDTARGGATTRLPDGLRRPAEWTAGVTPVPR